MSTAPGGGNAHAQFDNFASSDAFSTFFSKLCSHDKRSVSQVSRECRRAVESRVTRLELDVGSDAVLRRYTAVSLLRLTGSDYSWLRRVQLSGIKTLQIRSRSLFRLDLESIATVESLTSLDLEHCRLEDLEPLSAINALVELNLNHVHSVKGLPGLSSLTQLRTVHVGYSDVDRQYLHDLRPLLPLLENLDVAYSRDLTHTGAQETFRGFTRLTELTLDGYADMRNLEPLRYLNFKSFSCRDCCVQDIWLPLMSYLTGLTCLRLSDNPDITDKGLRWLSSLDTLVVLELNNLPHISTTALSVLNRLTMLTWLDAYVEDSEQETANWHLGLTDALHLAMVAGRKKSVSVFD